jgi:hypothetical protein
LPISSHLPDGTYPTPLDANLAKRIDSLVKGVAISGDEDLGSVVIL